MIDEIESSEVDLSSFQLHDELCDKIWEDNGYLKPKIRMRLLDIADDFIEKLKIDEANPIDIIFTGSLANYNFSKFSDIDLHIIYNFERLGDNVELIEDYFKAKKDDWNNKHNNLRIYGYPVELYVEDYNNPNTTIGVYSLTKDKWLSKPINMENIKDEDTIKSIAADVLTRIDDIIDSIEKTNDVVKKQNLSDRLKRLYDKIKDERKIGLRSSSREMSLGNILWKICRRMGYVQKINDIFDDVYDYAKSISEAQKHKTIKWR